MKSKFLASAAALALLSGAAGAQDLKFPVGEGPFNWDSYKAFDEKYNLDGQKITVLGPWLSVDQELFQSVIEYHVPKLQRTELAGDPNNPVRTSLTVTFK